MAKNPIEKIESKSVSDLISVPFSGPQGQIKRPNCVVCCCELREDAEKMFEADRSIVDIREFFQEHEIYFSPSVIRYHMKEHYKSEEKAIFLSEYASHLDSLIKERQERQEEIHMLYNVGRIELARALALQTNGDFQKETSRIEVVTKCIRAMMENMRTLNEMENASQEVRLIKQQIANAWKQIIENSKDEHEREMYVRTLHAIKMELEVSKDKNNGG